MPSAFRFLVTAGSSQEPIDRVRQWGNIFTGQTGLDIAMALTALGPVDLLTSNQQHQQQARQGAFHHRLSVQCYQQYAQLYSLLQGCMSGPAYHGVFMAAAVSDYRPAGVYQVLERKVDAASGEETWRVRSAQAQKVSSQLGEIAVRGEATAKLVDLFRKEWGYRGLLVKFKLEVDIAPEQLLAIGRASRLASGADYLVANTLDMVAGAQAGAWIIAAGSERWTPRNELAASLRDLTVSHLAAHP